MTSSSNVNIHTFEYEAPTLSAFDPVSATAGGLLIGSAAALLVLGSGRIAGVSGILGAALTGPAEGRAWRAAFLLGLPLGALLFDRAGGVDIAVSAPPALLVAAGLLVGIGTQVGSGCTSGHGVCGLARLSTRSAVATVTFMLTAALVVLLRGSS